jgi:hypothetical protein
MSATTQQQQTPGTGNGRTATARRTLKAGGKRTRAPRRTPEQMAAAKLPEAAAAALPGIKPEAIRLAQMVQWFGDATPAQQQRYLACLNAVALPKAA